MTLAKVVTDYVALKQALGMRFRTEARILRAFARALGDIELRDVTPQAVQHPPQADSCAEIALDTVEEGDVDPFPTSTASALCPHPSIKPIEPQHERPKAAVRIPVL